MKEVIDEIYKWINSPDDMQVCKQRIDELLRFVIGLRHSWVDADKPMSVVDVNNYILEVAQYEGLRVAHVPCGRDTLVEVE